MFEPTVKLTREELYEKVWTTPVQKLAADFGFSDVGLAKLCRRHQVPVPPRGYWARLQAGQKVKRTPLRPPTHPRLDKVEIYAHETQQRNTDVEAQEIPTILVADDRPITHPIALRIERSICRSKSQAGLLPPRRGRAVPIQVSAERLPRALRIVDALLTALEQAGHRLTWAAPYSAPMTVMVLEEPLTFLISENLKRREHQATGDQALRQKRDPWWRPERWEYQPTGQLRLSIESGKSLGIRRSWADGKKRRVEDSLGHFLVSLTAVAKALKRQREEEAERERRWAEERKQEAERAPGEPSTSGGRRRSRASPVPGSKASRFEPSRKGSPQRRSRQGSQKSRGGTSAPWPNGPCAMRGLLTRSPMWPG